MGKENTNEMRKAKISDAIRANKEIAELPKSIEWKTDGAYCAELVAHVLEICERYGMLPTVSHLASALGVPKLAVMDVKDGVIKANPDVVAAVAGFYSLCENATVASTMDGGTNNIAGIFMLKSQYGYKEEPRQVEITHNRLIGERKDPTAIAQRYADAMVVDAKEVKELPDGSADGTTETEAEYEW